MINARENEVITRLKLAATLEQANCLAMSLKCGVEEEITELMGQQKDAIEEGPCTSMRVAYEQLKIALERNNVDCLPTVIAWMKTQLAQ